MITSLQNYRKSSECYKLEILSLKFAVSLTRMGIFPSKSLSVPYQ